MKGMIVDLDNLHAFLRRATIRIVDLPDDEINKLDEEIAEERERGDL